MLLSYPIIDEERLQLAVDERQLTSLTDTQGTGATVLPTLTVRI